MKTWVSRAGETFKSVDWFVPPYMKGGVIRDLADAIDTAPKDQKHAVLEAGLQRLYGPDYLAAMLLERYEKVDPVSGFAIQIREAIEAAAFGLDHAAVATLLPVVEGVLRKLATAGGRDVGMGTKKLLVEVEQVAERERNAATLAQPPVDALFERVDMLDQLRDFMRDKLLISTVDYAGINNLNRHGILHGVFADYGRPGNFQKLISFLDALVFFISVGRSGISCLGPNGTTESSNLANYFRSLADARRLRPATVP